MRACRSWKLFSKIMVCMLVTVQVEAQSNCTQTLKLAEKKFETGHLRDVPDILTECMFKKQFTSEEILTAYKLLTLTYLYLDDSLNAEITFYKLLSEFPDYQLNESVEPAELVSLFRSYKTLPLFSIGIQAGTNISHVLTTMAHGIDNLSRRTEKYYSLPGYAAGISFSFPISKRMSINTGPNFNVVRYRNIRNLSSTNVQTQNFTNYNEIAENFNFAEVHFTENQSWIIFPLTLSTTVGKSQTQNYFFGGGSVGYLLTAKAKALRKNNYISSSGSDIKGPDVNVKGIRNDFNFWGIIGTGIRIKSGLNHINIEAEYNLGILNVVNASQRYSVPQLYNRYGYLDNDIKMGYFTIRGAYMISKYKPKKIFN